MQSNLSRRGFIKGMSALGGLTLLTSGCVGKIKKGKDLNGKFNVAIVGVGGRGRAAVAEFAKEPRVKIVAFCDVDDVTAAKSFEEFPNIPRFRDYRVMLDKLGKDIDGVAVITPDHMHYPISMWAIANGKHVYCEKPLCRTMWECRSLQDAAGKAGVYTQMGNQGHTFDGWRVIREWYENGLLGEIKEIYHWTNRPIWPQGDLQVPPAEPIPDTLSYNLWLGVAPEQPYNKAVLPFKWRGLRNYGTGAIGDMGCHFMDIPYTAFDLGYPTLVTAESSKFNDYSWPSEASIIYDFPGNAKRGPIKMFWYDGGRKPKSIERVPQDYLDDKRNANGTAIVGTKETVICGTYGEKPMIMPRERMVELSKSKALPDAYIPRCKDGPHLNWAYSCLDGKTPLSNFNYAAPFTEVALIGMAAIASGQPLAYNPKKMTFTNHPEADKYIKSLYAYKSEFLPSKCCGIF